jgi:hypothetical protein
VISKAAMQSVPESIVQRQLAHLNKADPAYARGQSARPEGRPVHGCPACVTSAALRTP